jgi:hypothetical protein
MVCGLLIETLPSSSMIEAPCDQSSQLALACRLQLLAHLEEARQVGRRRLVADRVDRRLAPDQWAGGAAEGQADPVVGAVLLAVLLADEHPAAVLLAEVFGDVGQLDQLVGIDVRRVAEADDHVRAGAGIGGDRGLLGDVLPPHEVDTDLDAGRLGEGGGAGAEDILVRLHEAHRAQHAQRGALLDRQGRRGGVGGGDAALGEGLGREGAGGGQRRGADAELERAAAGDEGHAWLSRIFLEVIG